MLSAAAPHGPRHAEDRHSLTGNLLPRIIEVGANTPLRSVTAPPSGGVAQMVRAWDS